MNIATRILKALGKTIVLLILPGASFLFSLFLLSAVNFPIKISQTLLWVIVFTPPVIVTYILYRLFKKDWDVWVIGVFSIMVASTLLSCPGISCGEKKRGANAAIKGNLAQIRVGAVLYLDVHGNYAKENFTAGPCPLEADSNSSMFGEQNIKDALNQIKKVNGGATPTCSVVENANIHQYAISSPLKSDKNKHWCIDDTGFVGAIDGPITKAACK